MKLLNGMLFNLIALCILVVTGCATNAEKTFLQENNITIERVHSDRVYVKNIYVTKTSHGILISGLLEQHFRPRRAIPGHVDIEIFDSHGQSQYKASKNHHRESVKARKAKFKFELNTVPENGSIIRVTHHE